MLPNQTVTLQGAAIGGSTNVYDDSGYLVASETTAIDVATTQETVAASVRTQPTLTTATPATESSDRFTFVTEAEAFTVEPATTTPEVISITDRSGTNENEQRSESLTWPYVVLVLLIGTAVFALVYRPD